MRTSDRQLPRIEPTKVWISPLSAQDYPFWPPPRRGRGSGSGSNNDGGDDKDAAPVEDGLDTDEDSQAEEDDDEAAERREINFLLEEGLVAMEEQARARRDSSSSAAKGAGDAADSDSGGQAPSGSDSDSSSSSSSASMPGLPGPSDEDSEDMAAIRGSADVAIKVAGGILKYYSNKQAFTAECSEHASCVKTRQATPGAAMAKAKHPGPALQAKGRPLGYLAAWLRDGSNHTTKDDHWKSPPPTWAVRDASRRSVAASEAGRTLLSHERAKRLDEDSEPEGLA